MLEKFAVSFIIFISFITSLAFDVYIFTYVLLLISSLSFCSETSTMDKFIHITQKYTNAFYPSNKAEVKMTLLIVHHNTFSFIRSFNSLYSKRV